VQDRARRGGRPPSRAPADRYDRFFAARTVSRLYSRTPG
jgi:hypothetical protein